MIGWNEFEGPGSVLSRAKLLVSIVVLGEGMIGWYCFESDKSLAKRNDANPAASAFALLRRRSDVAVLIGT
jgi:hypothetical protein